MTRQVTVVPYDPDWPRRFGEERATLAAVFARTAAVIEHVGSTAVPGLGAKPVIDVMIGVAELAEIERRIPALEAVGYEYVSAYEQQLPERRYFRRPRNRPRAVHLHGVVTGSGFWIRQLAFRDYLRAYPESAEAYGRLKRDLASRLTGERYTEAKRPFIEGVLALALAAGERSPGRGVRWGAPDAENVDPQLTPSVDDQQPTIDS